jgi:hypothetical protein
MYGSQLERVLRGLYTAHSLSHRHRHRHRGVVLSAGIVRIPCHCDYFSLGVTLISSGGEPSARSMLSVFLIVLDDIGMAIEDDNIIINPHGRCSPLFQPYNLFISDESILTSLSSMLFKAFSLSSFTQFVIISSSE